jgi:hypothetical protein
VIVVIAEFSRREFKYPLRLLLRGYDVSRFFGIGNSKGCRMSVDVDIFIAVRPLYDYHVCGRYRTQEYWGCALLNSSRYYKEGRVVPRYVCTGNISGILAARKPRMEVGIA